MGGWSILVNIYIFRWGAFPAKIVNQPKKNPQEQDRPNFQRPNKLLIKGYVLEN